MIEYNLSEQAEIPPGGEFSVRVIGVGGAGANVLDRMALEGSDEAELLTLNTDVRALSSSVSNNKIQLGKTLLKGMGAGGDPELGKQGALEAVDEIRGSLRGFKMAFVCVGLGGGTGSGAAPEVCRIAKEEGVFLVVFATLPFSFEGKRRMDQALDALDRIGKYANAVVTFDNDRMGELIVPKEGVQQAFAAADKIISQAIRATMKIVSHPGIIRIGMDELLSALNNENSRCLFGFGVAKGDNRAHEAMEQALKSPLLDKGKMLEQAKNVLVHVGGGDSMTLFEIELVMQELSKHIDDSKTQILFGTGTDKKLGGNLTVTIISSLSGPGGQRREAPAESPVPNHEPEPAAPRLGSPLTAPMSPPPAPAPEPEKSFEPVAAAEEVSAEKQVEEPQPEEPVAEVDEKPLPAPEPEPPVAEEPVEEPAPPAEEETPAVEAGDEETEVEEAPPVSEEEPAPEPEETQEEAEPKPPVDLQPIRKTAVVPPQKLRKPIVEVGASKRPKLNLGFLSGSSKRDEEDEGSDTIGKMLEQGLGGGASDESPDPAVESVDHSEDATVPVNPAAGDEGDVIVARTEDEQKITLSRLVPGSSPSPGDVRPGTLPTRPEGGEDDSLSPELDAAAAQHQQMLQLEPLSKGRFAKTEPTIVDGEDMDVPTFLRKRRK
ncbi:MAG: cell division FtsZ family protein [Verrucomicrobiae bacterium]|nr:cell division FtsZ family protein [Verrucomicrobiae bacterium]